MPVLVKCQWCNKEFTSATRKGKTAKYCSRQCYWSAWKGSHPELYKLSNRICEECGKEFHPKDKDHGKRFCSRECQRKNGRTKRTVSCTGCGNLFLRDNADEKFCSHECSWVYNKGDKQPSFNDWVTHDERGYIRFTGGHPTHAREYVHDVIWKELHPGGGCELCGKSLEHVHHKDENKGNNNDSNLMGLCNSCHLRIHHPKGYKIGTRAVCAR